MKSNRRMILSIVWIVLGASLLGANLTGLLGDYWSGLGGGLLGVGVVQTIRNIRYLRSAEYREKVDTTNQDERNKFLANKAWAWAGYLYVLTAAIATIVFQIIGKTELATAAGFSVCIIMVFHWLSYLYLQKKY
ncbi:MAG: hypothetical protein MSH58_08275 [Clostridiales bacterium]|nr:hypothetical protein [Clostridiales bacterium]